MHIYQSFQYVSAVNSPMVATTGLDNGRISLTKILKSPAPSIFADSVISMGIPPMNPFTRIICHTETIVGTISAQMVFFKCRYFTHRIYHGTNPPENNVVKKK